MEESRGNICFFNFPCLAEAGSCFHWVRWLLCYLARDATELPARIALGGGCMILDVWRISSAKHGKPGWWEIATASFAQYSVQASFDHYEATSGLAEESFENVFARLACPITCLHGLCVLSPARTADEMLHHTLIPCLR